MPAANAIPITRRLFLQKAAGTCAALSLPRLCLADNSAPLSTSGAMSELTTGLLTDWCDGLLKLQVNDPAQPRLHGSFHCPACVETHGRCGDAAYPLLCQAARTGQSRYLDAALAVVEWMKNVDSPDGAWTNDLRPDSWKGTTVFASIALADAIRFHGGLLNADIKASWLARLKRAAEFILANFNMDYGNINYPVTGAYALALLGKLFDEDKYRRRGKELAHSALQYFTPDKLLYGEGHPQTQVSPKGCRAVDLGYNVEESLPSLALYGQLEHDDEVLRVVTEALAAHIEFMLPDGGWDNSWGTRSYKWTYWGSRTSDGCAPAYALLAQRHPAFAIAAWRNTQLLRACTRDGLLYGGPHYALQGMPACVHHTFTHAKSLAVLLDEPDALDAFDVPQQKRVEAEEATPRRAIKLANEYALPRENAGGVRQFPEIDTFLVSYGPWRATVTGYDWIYRTFHATGGAMSLLYHLRLGPLCAASLAKYVMAEPNNMQPLPDSLDFPLTPRIEMRQGSATFTNLYDLHSEITHHTKSSGIEFSIRTQLLDEKQQPPPQPAAFQLAYKFTEKEKAVIFQIKPLAAVAWSFILPLISPQGESVRRVNERRCEVAKPGGVVIVESDAPLIILEPDRKRVFNNVPGLQAIPFAIESQGTGAIECRLTCR